MFDIIQLMKAVTAYSMLTFMFLAVLYIWYLIFNILCEFLAGCIAWPRSVTKKESTWKWHWIPYCVCHTTGDSRLLKGKNFLWLNWLFCFTKGD